MSRLFVTGFALGFGTAHGIRQMQLRNAGEENLIDKSLDLYELSRERSLDDWKQAAIDKKNEYHERIFGKKED
jgi:hypothetical protein